jgi:transcriptional regulator with XRE-family HTH domain
VSLLALGPLMRERRGERGLREFAEKLGVSAATLSRIERGRLPDLETFSKICGVLRLDPAELLGMARPPGEARSGGSVAVHFRADQVMDPQLAKDLGVLILAAERFSRESCG